MAGSLVDNPAVGCSYVTNLSRSPRSYGDYGIGCTHYEKVPDRHAQPSISIKRPHNFEVFLFAIISPVKIIKRILKITPNTPNGFNMVYLLGYGGSIWHSKRHLRLLKNEGYTVLAMDFRDVLKNRNPQDLITVMDEVDKVLQNEQLIGKKTIIVGVEDPAKRQFENLHSDGVIWYDQAKATILAQQVITQDYFPEKPIRGADVVNARKKKTTRRDSYPENYVPIVNAFGDKIAIDRKKIREIQS